MNTSLQHFGWLLVPVALSMSCAGGQTGDVGVSADACGCELDPASYGTVTLDAARTAGHPVDEWLVAALGPNHRLEVEMIATAPPDWWTTRGLSYSSLESMTRIRLTGTPSGLGDLRRMRPMTTTLTTCPDIEVKCELETVELAIDAELELLELGGTYAGSGTLMLLGSPPGVLSLSFPGLAERCEASRNESGAIQLACSVAPSGDVQNGLVASEQCVESASWVPLPLEPSTQANWQSLLMLPALAAPWQLDCTEEEGDAGPPEPISLSIAAELAATTCAPFPLRALMNIDWSFMDTTETAMAVATIGETSCQSGDYVTAIEDLRHVDPNAGKCSTLTLHATRAASNPLGASLLLVYQIDTQGQKVAGLDYVGPLLDRNTKSLSGRHGICHGQRVIQ